MRKLCAFADEASPAISGQIAAMKRCGIDYLEIRGVDGKNINSVDEAKVKEVRRMLDAEGLAVWSIGSPIGKYSLDKPFDKHLEDFKWILEAASILNAGRIRMFSFYPAEGDSPEATEEKVMERLAKFCELTPPEILLCHENEKHIFGETPENCLKIHQNFPSIRAIFDPANYVQCGVDTLAAWKQMRDYVDYMHIKDAVADGTVVPAGQGIGNLPQIVADYLAGGGKVMTLEPHLTEFVGLKDLENSESVKGDFARYRNSDEAFDAAVAAFREILTTINR